jgi:SAM-dependent methyltransferase
MMDFKELVTYRNKINAISITDMTKSVVDDLNVVNTDVKNNFCESDTLKNEISTTLYTLVKAERALTEHKRLITDTMLSEAMIEYAKPHNCYLSIIDNMPTINYFDRVMQCKTTTYELLKSKISLYTNWNTPAIQFCPAHGELTEHIVGCDPLYLVDTKLEYLQPVKQKFTQQYQDRLRYYKIESDYDNDNMLAGLPKEQIGFCLAYGFFNYRPRVIIKQYLAELFNILKPGGVILFTYNNCENPENVTMFNKDYAEFILKTDLIKDLTDLSYEILNIVDIDSTISWLEVKKPGTLTSNRAGQTLASLIHKKE